MQALDLRLFALVSRRPTRLGNRQNKSWCSRGQLSENFLVGRQTKHMNIAMSPATALFGNSVGVVQTSFLIGLSYKNPFVKLACNTMECSLPIPGPLGAGGHGASEQKLLRHF